MSQILSFQKNYQIDDEFKNLVIINDFKSLLNYLKDDSIIILSEEEFALYKRNLILLKAVFQEIEVLIVGEYQVGFDFFLFVEKKDLNLIIKRLRIRKFKKKNKMIFFEQLSNLDILRTQ